MKRGFMLRVRLDSEEVARLKMAARELGITMSDVVRQLIRRADLIVRAKLKREP